ncbi:carboxylic ester hydrolase [Aureococcus anophagefferens]|nr:carboxylic ester hydrolase [Aureococcus anophagefferens]
MLALAFSLVASAVADDLVVSLDGLGKLQGAARGVVREFHGVPFAAPPQGAMRWRSPAAPSAWDGVRDATSFHASCAQPSGFSPTITNTSEDCLFVDFYAPSGASAAPVFVWIHGGGQRGGFTNGGAEEARLNGSAAILSLQASGVADLPVIAVVQYRLGVFGFAGSDAIRDPDTNATGNWGFEDQIAAVAFVKQYAASFGGDPANVAIAGQSAGGASVGNLVVAPKARGLFQRAIGMSGSFSDWAAVALSDQESAYATLLSNAGCSDAKCMRQKSPEDLLSAYNGVSCTACFEATVDGVLLADYPNELMEANGLNGLSTWVANEYAAAGDAADLLKSHYPQASYAARGDASKSYVRGVAVETDQSMRCALRRGAAMGSNNYVYSFDRGVGGTNYANHADDIPFVFSATAALADAGGDADDVALASKMTRIFFAFARTGDPNDGNGDIMPNWAPFTGETSQVMHFDTTLALNDDAAVQTACAYWKNHHYYGKQS